MITQKALVYEADRMGLGVSDDELRDYLHQGQMGQMIFPGGNFIGQQAYEDFIQNQFNMSVQQFEQEVKAEIAQQKLLAADQRRRVGQRQRRQRSKCRSRT